MKYKVTIPAITFEVDVAPLPDAGGGTPTVPNPPTGGGTTTPPPTTTPTDKKRFMGVNTFHYVPLDKLPMFGSQRLYVDAAWVMRPGGLFVQPIWQAEKPDMRGLDDYLTAARARGVDVMPCVNRTPDWYAGVSENNGMNSNNYPPVKPGNDRKRVESWADWAEFWFQFVARYGSVQHPDSVLRVDTTPKYQNQPLNVKKSGLGLVKCVEIGNEYDRWWDVGTDKYLRPEEYAAMLAACYQACKRADPAITVVMGGLTGFDMKYLQAMLAAFQALGLPFQSDKINVHHYSNRYNEYAKWPPTWRDSSACFPEQDKDFPMIREVVQFGRSLGLETWVTEFGADSRPPSWMHVHVDGMTDEEAQAQLLVRTYEAYRVAGVERAYMFMAADEPGSANGGLWQNCGVLTNEASGHKPKAAWAALERLAAEYAAG